MLFLVFGLFVVIVLVLVGRGARTLRVDTRWPPTLVALLAAVGAVAAGLRGAWIVSVILIICSAYFGHAASRGAAVGARSGGMAPNEARSILGVGADASAVEIEAAYRRLILRAHPDHGGSSGLAAQLNAARDCLIKKK